MSYATFTQHLYCRCTRVSVLSCPRLVVPIGFAWQRKLLNKLYVFYLYLYFLKCQRSINNITLQHIYCIYLFCQDYKNVACFISGGTAFTFERSFLFILLKTQDLILLTIDVIP